MQNNNQVGRNYDQQINQQNYYQPVQQQPQVNQRQYQQSPPPPPQQKQQQIQNQPQFTDSKQSKENVHLNLKL